MTALSPGAPTAALINSYAPALSIKNDTGASALVKADEVHAYDAVTALLINVTIIICLLAAYYVKRFRLYHLPESALSLMVGVLLGGVARLSTDDLQLFEFVSRSEYLSRLIDHDHRAVFTRPMARLDLRLLFLASSKSRTQYL